MQSAVRLENMIQIVTDMMLSQSIKIPTIYSEAYLSGRDLSPVLPTGPNLPEISRKENAIRYTKPTQSLQKPKPESEVEIRFVNSSRVSPSTVKSNSSVTDWTDLISKDVQLMSSSKQKADFFSDSYIMNMPTRMYNYFMSRKFRCPDKNIRDSIARSGISNANSIQEDAVKSEAFQTAVRNAVGRVIKRKISSIEHVPEQLKRDIDLVFSY